MNERAYSFLGLLHRGGKVIIGENIEKALRKGGALVLSSETSHTVERLREKGVRAGCLILEGASKGDLGRAIGYEQISAIYVKDGKASRALKEKWQLEKGAL